jgi:hypothetical protein
MSSVRKPVIVILVLLAALLLYPFQKTLVPEKRVLVVTKDMHPVTNALVRQSWTDYSLGAVGHEEDLRTDANGRITFPARTIRAPLLVRIFGPLASIVGQGVHASFGVRTDMFPLANKDVTVSSEVVQRQPDEILYRLEP